MECDRRGLNNRVKISVLFIDSKRTGKSPCDNRYDLSGPLSTTIHRGQYFRRRTTLEGRFCKITSKTQSVLIPPVF